MRCFRVATIVQGIWKLGGLFAGAIEAGHNVERIRRYSAREKANVVF